MAQKDKFNKIYSKIRTKGGRVSYFSIQYIVWYGGKFVEVFRVDNADHGNIKKRGIPHAHKFYSNKKKSYVYQIGLPKGRDLNNLILDVLNDLILNGQRYKNNFLYNR